jgi:Protein of unknown function (DUF1302)
MRTNVRGSGTLREVARTLSVLVLAVAMVGLYVTCSVAGDASAAPSSNADTTNAASKFLTQPASASEMFSGLHVSGYLSQTFGMWQNPTALRDITKSRNNLAVARTLLQVDENYSLSSNDHFFMREWFVYEPPYSFNSANAEAYSSAASGFNPAAAAPSWGHFANGFYNQYNVRDAWWEHTAGPLNLYIGNQIVVWGQSLAFRVGDVINPQDTTWAFGFANLEQSRIPQWMIHPILNLPDFGPFSSNFIEGVIIPGFQPMWNSNEYADGRYSGEMAVAGRVSNGFLSGVAHAPSGRFDEHYDNKWVPSRNWYIGPATALGGAAITEFGYNNGGTLPPPFSREFMWCNQWAAQNPADPAEVASAGTGDVVSAWPQGPNAPGFGTGFNPIPAGLRRGCTVGRVSNAIDWGPTSGTSLFGIGQWHVPAVTLANMQEGARIHTLIGQTEVTALYYNAFQNYPIFVWQPFTNQWRGIFYPVQYVGLTADRPVPMPSTLGEYLPMVGRIEAVYANHQPFDDFNPFNLSGVRFSDTVAWMAALDVDQAYAPWLTTTGNLSANIEVYDFMTLASNNSMQELPDGAELSMGNNHKHNVSVLFNLGTSWWWNAFAPDWIMVFNPIGRTFLLFPSITLTPPWTNKYFVKLQAIEVLGGAREALQAGGIFKGQSMLTAQFQYNFSLL